MRKARRKILIHILERVAIALILLNAGLYFGAFRPVQNLAVAEQQRYAAARHRVLQAEGRVARLEKYESALPGAGTELEKFKRDHIPARRRAFSRAADMVRKITEESGVQLANDSFHLVSNSKEPLERLGIEFTIAGTVTEIVKFAYALESSSDLILIREFSCAPGEGGLLGLRLGVDMYLMP